VSGDEKRLVRLYNKLMIVLFQYIEYVYMIFVAFK
jgi:hypothetical protein